MTKNRIQPKLVVVAVLLVSAVLATLRFLGDGPDTHVIETSEQPAIARVELDPTEVGETELVAHDSTRTAIVESPSPAEEPLTADSTNTSAPAGVPVRVVVDANRWLAGGAFAVFIHTAIGGEQVPYEATRDADGSWRLMLSAAPSSLDEFKVQNIAGLSAHPVALTPLDADPAGAMAPRFELRVALDDGAWLQWQDSVPFEDRAPVDVAFGGGMAPPARTNTVIGRRAGLVELHRGLTLPVCLPRPVTEEGVWVGAARHVWRGFLVTPPTERVEVVLERAAIIRVLHDRPPNLGYRVVVSNFAMGDKQVLPIIDDQPIIFSERSAELQKVWIQGPPEGPASSAVLVQPIAGETIDVDLRIEAQVEARGGLTIVVSIDPDVQSLVADEFSVGVFRRAPQPHWSKWVAVDIELAKPEIVGNQQTFAASGLEPTTYLVRVEPFGACAEVEVVAGETKEVVLRLDQLGKVLLEYPAEYERTVASAMLVAAGTTADVSSFVSINANSDRRRDPQLCLPGTYIATVRVLGTTDLPALESDPFVVEVGVTTVVALRPKPQMHVSAEAVRADTGEPIAFDLTFWVGVNCIAVESEAKLQLLVSFKGANGAHTGLTWTCDAYTGLVRIEVPKSSLWTFEAIEPRTVADGDTITLRAMPRSQ